MNNDNKKKEKHDKKNDKASKNNEKLVKNKKVEKQKYLPEETSIKKIQQESASDVSKSLIDKSEASSINGIDKKKLKHIANKSANVSPNVSPLEKKRKKKSKHKPKISDVPNEHLMSDVKTNVLNGDEEQSAFSVKYHKDSKTRNDQVPDIGSHSAPIGEKVLENVEKKNKCLPSLEFNKDNIEDNELSSVESFQEIIQLLSIQLPQIIPHVLLARRGTVLPLLLIAIEHHPSIEVRDNLLTILFNLTKKPDEEMRSVIVKGFVEIVARQNARNNATIVEAEILPQLWQQIEHKHLERRILVAETCAWLLPYIPSDIRDSLVFSMLLQLVQQDRENQVRIKKR